MINIKNATKWYITCPYSMILIFRPVAGSSDYGFWAFPKPKTWGLFLIILDIILSHCAKFLLVTNFSRLNPPTTGLQSYSGGIPQFAKYLFFFCYGDGGDIALRAEKGKLVYHFIKNPLKPWPLDPRGEKLFDNAIF